jgi:hypothetical protein
MIGYGIGLQVEPFVDIELELSMHGILSESGKTSLGSVVVQHCDERGAWISQRPVKEGELTSSERSSLQSNAETVAGALSTAGYFGPFSIDGFIWRSSDGIRRLRPLSDLNARYTMGFFESMSGQEEVLEFIEGSRR